jgi:glutamine amidotransferase
MCIAIYKPAGAWITKEQLRTSYENNPHGAGYCYHDGEAVRIVKGFFSWRSFWKSYKRHVTSDMPAFAHFRIATRGEKDISNCHPFDLGNGALMHNGPCLNYRYCDGDKERSDTRQFAEDFISGLESKQVKRILPMIEHFIGTEKIVLMFDDGEVLIAGEKEGHWAHGIWWSNHGYEPRKVYTGAYSKSTLDDNEDDDIRWNSYFRRKDAKVVEMRPAIEWEKPRLRASWSNRLQTFVPKIVEFDGLPHVWDERLSAYLPEDLDLFGIDQDELEADDNYVYTYDRHGGVDVIADVINTADELRVFLTACANPNSLSASDADSTAIAIAH